MILFCEEGVGNMKKVSLVILLAIMLTLTSCGTGSESDENTLTFWAYEPQSLEDRNAYNDLIESFEIENDVVVRVSWIPKDSYNQRLNTAIVNGKAPDVAYLDQPLTATYVNNNQLLDISEYLENSEVLEDTDFYSAALDTVEIDGSYYGLPLTIGTTVLLYNKDLVDYPEDITSWDTWLDVATDASSSSIAAFSGIGNGGYAGWYFGGFLKAAGGELMNPELTEVTFNSSAGVKAASFLKNLYDLSPIEVVSSTSAFGNGNVLFKLAGGSDVESLRTNFPNLNFDAMLMPPAEEGGISYSNIGGDNIVVFKSVTNKDLSFEFLEFLNSDTHAINIAGYTGNFPANKMAIGSTYEEDNVYQVLLEQLETASVRPKIDGWLEVNDSYLGPALESIFLETKTIQAALDLAVEQAEDVLFN